jgi:hypothetical protein
VKIRTRLWDGALILVAVFSALPARSQSEAQSASRRVYEGVVDMKQKTIGTIVLMDISGTSVTGWIRLGKFVPIDGGTVSENSAEFRAAGNSYRIDERKGRIVYSGPDGSGDRIISRLTPLSGLLKELTEGERFSGNEVATLDVDGRLRRFNVASPSLWKRQGPPFEDFRRPEVLLQREITIWVSPDQSASAEVIEEPEGMDIPLKPPKPPKEKKKTEKK